MSVFTLRPLAKTWDYLADTPHAASVLRHAVELVAGGSEFCDLPDWAVPSYKQPPHLFQPRYAYKLDDRCISIRVTDELKTVISGITEAADKIRKAIGLLLKPTIDCNEHQQTQEGVTDLSKSKTWNKYKGLFYCNFRALLAEFEERLNGGIPDDSITIDGWMDRYLHEAVVSENLSRPNLERIWTVYVRLMIFDNVKSINSNDWHAGDIDKVISDATKYARDLQKGKLIKYYLVEGLQDEMAMLYREALVGWFLSKMRKIREELKEAGSYHYAV